MINRKLLALTFFVTLSALALGFGIPTAIKASDGAVKTRSGTLSIAQTTDTGPAAITKTNFKFNAIGAKWSGTADVSIRFRAKGQWTDWTAMVLDEDAESAKDQDSAVRYSNLLFTEPADEFQYRIDLIGAGFNKLEFYYLKTTKDSSWQEQLFGWIFAPARGADLDVISRADWGADESLRQNAEGEERWPVEYAEPKTFIIHHTAGSNGQPSLAQAKAVMRGIYYYHTVVRGWGDIGYNFVLDKAGHVFEGRSGGDGAIGAHTYRENCSSKGAEQDYNPGSIGIAVMGNYQTQDTFSSALASALSHLIAVKGRALNIDPAGETFFRDRTMPDVISHIDIDCTLCPGTRVQTKLDTIRSQAAAEYATLPAPSEDGSIRAARVGQSDKVITVLAGETQEVWADFRNEGTATWRREVNAPTLVAGNPLTRSLQASSWIDGNVVGVMENATVVPGGTGRFRFNVTGPTGRSKVSARFKLQAQGRLLANTSAALTVRIASTQYAAKLIEAPFPKKVIQNSTRTVTFTYRNAGRNTWLRDEVKLKVSGIGGAPNAFSTLHEAAPASSFKMLEETVQPGKWGHFIVTFKGPRAGGHYTQRLALLRNGRLIKGSSTNLRTKVDSLSRAKLIELGVPDTMLDTAAPGVTVRLKNTGSITWSRSYVLKITNDDFGPSSFYDPTWPGAVGEILMDQTSVAPGGVATYRFILRAPAHHQKYVQIFQLMDHANPDNIVEHDRIAATIQVEPTNPPLKAKRYTAERVDENIPATLSASGRRTVTVKYINNGSKTWDRTVKLNVYGALYRRPEFYDSTWPGRFGGIVMNETSVPKGGTATYSFQLNAPDEPQAYQMIFRLSLGFERNVIPGSNFSKVIKIVK